MVSTSTRSAHEGIKHEEQENCGTPTENEQLAILKNQTCYQGQPQGLERFVDGSKEMI